MQNYGIIVLLLTAALFGCATKPASDSEGKSSLLTGTWRVEDIDGGGVIDRSQVTINFDAQGKVSGSTGCNRYTGGADLSTAIFRVEDVVTTRRACGPAITQQERRFLNALNAAQRYEFDSGIWIVVYDQAGRRRLKLIRTVPVTGSQGGTQDSARSTRTLFTCESAGEVGIRFVGPETVALTTEDGTSILPRIPTASGAQYGHDTLRFWNKGNEARLRIDGQDYSCMRTDQSRS